MAIHDRLAEKARASGKAPAQFHTAAQKHANATWFFIILAAVVWYFSSWLWALIPGVLGIMTMFQSISATMIASRLEKHEEKDVKRNEALKGSMPLQVAEKIIQDYGAIMQSGSPIPGGVADASKLPHSKNKIKAALITGMKATSDPRSKEVLKIGYIQLSDWQEGVGETDQGLDLSNIDLNGDPVKLAKQILAQGASQEGWQSIVSAEQEASKQELIDLGLW